MYSRTASSVIYALEKKICQLTDIEQKLCAAEDLGKLLWGCPKNIYSLPDIENKLIEDFSGRLNAIRSFTDPAANTPYIFIISEAYSSGGHTRLMEMIASRLNSKPELIITRKVDHETLKKLSGTFSVIHQIKDARLTDKVGRIVKISKGFRHIVLNTHPDDISAIVGAGISKKQNKNINISFINHADHAFSFGASISDIWFIISNYGEEIDKLRALTGRKTFLGIPISSKIELAPKPPNEVKIIISGGSNNKYKQKKYHSPIPLLYRLTRNHKDAVIHVIGPKKTSAWAILMRAICIGRIKIHEVLPYQDYIELTNKADVYLDSYPMIGGTAFVEQIARGKYSVGLESPVQGYSPADLIRSKDIKCLSLDEYPSDLMMRIRQVHDPEAVCNRFTDAVERGKLHANPMQDILRHETNTDFFTTSGFKTKLLKESLLRLCSYDILLKLLIISPWKFPSVALKSLIAKSRQMPH